MAQGRVHRLHFGTTFEAPGIDLAFLDVSLGEERQKKAAPKAKTGKAARAAKIAATNKSVTAQVAA